MLENMKFFYAMSVLWKKQKAEEYGIFNTLVLLVTEIRS
jgi:hypothetical protein